MDQGRELGGVWKEESVETGVAEDGSGVVETGVAGVEVEAGIGVAGVETGLAVAGNGAETEDETGSERRNDWMKWPFEEAPYAE